MTDADNATPTAPGPGSGLGPGPGPEPGPVPGPKPEPEPEAVSAPGTLQHRFDGPEDAPVLVLGPCLGTTWHMWDRQIPELTCSWRVFRYDLPGHGGAPAEPATGMDDLADRLIATLDGLGVDRFGYAGCSIGSAIGTSVALRHPHRLATLALVSASARPGTPDAWRQRGVVVRAGGLGRLAHSTPERWFTDAFRAAQPAIVDWAVQMAHITDPDAYSAACEAMAAHDVREELGRIAVPTLVIGGSDDPETPPADARVLVAGIPDARLAVVPGACHLVPVEQPAAVTDLLVRHFNATWSAPAPPAAALAALPPTAAVAPDAPPAVGPDAAPAPDRYDEGVTLRREVLGDAHVDRVGELTDDFAEDFERLLTRSVWGEVWTRPGLDRRTRSVVTLTALTAGAAVGHHDDLAAHTRAALRNGLTPAEIKEILLHAAVYCGFPAAGAAFEVARRVIAEETRIGPEPARGDGPGPGPE
jgi:3-oxoadipate enol-lactonase/4-carboxymuconolactone decarboxylase